MSHLSSPSRQRARVGELLACALFSVACRSPERSPAETPPAVERSSSLTPVAPEVKSEGAAAVGERAPSEVDPRLQPPDRPFQRLAFSDQRLAQLAGNQLILRRAPNLWRVKRIAVLGARNVVAGVGGDFIAAGSENVYRIAKLDDQAELLAPVPRLGPTTILPAADSSDHFWLLYEGIPTLPEFDLQETVVAHYMSVLGWTQLRGFDGRAISNPGDGSFLYTTPGGLRRVSAEGKAHAVAAPALGEHVWRLLPASAEGAVWAATPHDVQLLQPANGAQDSGAPSGAGAWVSARRIELPPHAVAMGGQGSDLAVLAVESFEPARARLRIEVYSQGSERRQVLRFDDVLPGAADAGAPRLEFAPEIALAPGGPWVAVFGYGLSVFDWRTGARLFPIGAPPAAMLRAQRTPADVSRSQNLAPSAR